METGDQTEKYEAFEKCKELCKIVTFAYHSTLFLIHYFSRVEVRWQPQADPRHFTHSPIFRTIFPPPRCCQHRPPPSCHQHQQQCQLQQQQPALCQHPPDRRQQHSIQIRFCRWDRWGKRLVVLLTCLALQLLLLQQPLVQQQQVQQLQDQPPPRFHCQVR